MTHANSVAKETAGSGGGFGLFAAALSFGLLAAGLFLAYGYDRTAADGAVLEAVRPF